MKIVLCVGGYKDVFDANVKIALELSLQLKEHGNECVIFFCDDFSNKVTKGETNGILSFRLPASGRLSIINKHYDSQKRKGMSKVDYSIRYPINALLYYFFKDGDKYSYKKYTDFINSYIIKNNIDYVITFTNPFFPSYYVAKRVKKAKILYYQCDPFGLHELLDIHNQKQRIRQELEVIKNCEYVFTTYPLYEQYKKHILYSKYVDKMIPVNFPNLKISSGDYNGKIDRSYDIFYLGSISDKYRDPKDVIDFIMSSSLPTKVHFIGNIQSGSLKRAQEKYKGRIVVEPQISNEESERLINSNVFLLNINNSISNQSPSKLIDYISTGNPIINCIKLPSDISSSVLNNYKNHYNFFEYDQNDIRKFDAFLIQNRNTRIPSDRIAELYCEYTPEYVSGIINAVLKKSFEKTDE